MLSITKKCGTLINQTLKKPQEAFEFKLIKPNETFSFKAFGDLGLDSNWMIGLTVSEICNTVLKITEENNKFQLYTDLPGEFSFG